MNDVEISVFPKDEAGEFRTLLKEHHIKYSERVFVRDSVDGGMTFLGEFMLLGKTLAGPVVGAIGGWVVARQGRKVRVKMGDIEAEAGSVEEVKQLLALVEKRSIESTKGEEESGSAQ